jgi:hypothetical protein
MVVGQLIRIVSTVCLKVSLIKREIFIIGLVIFYSSHEEDAIGSYLSGSGLRWSAEGNIALSAFCARTAAGCNVRALNTCVCTNTIQFTSGIWNRHVSVLVWTPVGTSKI